MNVGTSSGLESNEFRQDHGKSKIKSMSHQLAESRDKFVRVITKQSLFEIFPELSRAGKILALVPDKSRTNSGEIIVDAL